MKLTIAHYLLKFPLIISDDSNYMNRINLKAASLFNDLIKTIQSKHVCFCSAERKEKMASICFGFALAK